MNIRISNPTGQPRMTQITDETGRPFQYVTRLELDPMSGHSNTGPTAHLTFMLVELDMLAEWPEGERAEALARLAAYRTLLDRIEADILRTAP